MSIKIGKRKIGLNEPPFIISEISANHNGSLERALSIVKESAKAGVDAIKLQTYKPETMTLKSSSEDFKIKDGSLWDGYNLFDLYAEAHTPWEWHDPIFRLADELGLIYFSSPFDETAVDFLEDMNVPAYKIASFEITDYPLLEKVGKTRKPVILSTGMATFEEVKDAIGKLNSSGAQSIALLKCTSTYPSSPKNSNLRTIPDMRDKFNCEVGLSDHTLGCGVAITAISNGATIIEKHVTLDRTETGPDSNFSMEPEEMQNLVEETMRAWESLGRIHYGPSDSEKSSMKYRRSIFAIEDIKEGTSFTKKNIKCVRPFIGIEPKYYGQILGSIALKKIEKGTPITWDLIEK